MKTILIADDEPLTLEILTEVFTELGFTLFLAQNGKEAYDLITNGNGKVDLAIVDLNMPVMDGTSFIRKAREEGFDFPIIVLSGTCFLLPEELEKEVYAALGKPYKFVQVIHTSLAALGI